MSKRALIIVDIQNDYFPGGKWTLENMDAAAANARRVLEASRAASDVVVHVRHENPTAEAPFFVKGTEGAEINEQVRPQDGEPVVVKHFPNSYRETNLKQILDQHGVDSLVICGAMSNMCIDAATRASADFGYTCTLIHDACAARDMEFNGIAIPASHVHAAFMASLGMAYANLVSTDDYISALAQAA